MIRRLRDVPDDVALGLDLVREYVVAPAEETGQDVELVLSIEEAPALHEYPFATVPLARSL